MIVDLNVMIAIVGTLIGVYGWFSGRDKKIKEEAKWKSSVDTKLDIILGLQKDVEVLQTDVGKLQERLRDCEKAVDDCEKFAEGVKQISLKCHKRVDKITKKEEEI